MYKNWIEKKDGFIIVFSVQERVTFEYVENYIKLIKKHSNSKSLDKTILVGSKIDLENREISKEEAIEFAKKNALLYFEASALTGENVEKIFEKSAEISIIESIITNKSSKPSELNRVMDRIDSLFQFEEIEKIIENEIKEKEEQEKAIEMTEKKLQRMKEELEKKKKRIEEWSNKLSSVSKQKRRAVKLSYGKIDLRTNDTINLPRSTHSKTLVKDAIQIFERQSEASFLKKKPKNSKKTIEPLDPGKNSKYFDVNKNDPSSTSSLKLFPKKKPFKKKILPFTLEKLYQAQKNIFPHLPIPQIIHYLVKNIFQKGGKNTEGKIFFYFILKFIFDFLFLFIIIF